MSIILNPILYLGCNCYANFLKRGNFFKTMGWMEFLIAWMGSTLTILAKMQAPSMDNTISMCLSQRLKWEQRSPKNMSLPIKKSDIKGSNKWEELGHLSLIVIKRWLDRILYWNLQCLPATLPTWDAPLKLFEYCATQLHNSFHYNVELMKG